MHRCGRAGRKPSRNDEISPPTVFSFFTREFSLASSVVELLKACNAWVDPNLLALIDDKKSPDKISANSDTSKKRKRKQSVEASVGGTGNKDDSDNDQFAFLGRSVLKRASHVSDAEDSEDDDSS